MHNSNNQNLLVDFRVTLERLFSGGEQRIENLHPQSNLATLVGQSKLIMNIQYYVMRGEENYSVLVNNVAVEHPGTSYASNNIGIDSAVIKIGDTSFEPNYVQRYSDNGFFRSYHETDLGETLFGNWMANSNVSIAFLSQADGKTVPYANIHLQGDKIGQYSSIIERQLDDLWEAYSAQDCVRFAPIDGDDDCFLTTAATACIGLADDCWELETLREFRDQHLLRTAAGTDLVREYYEIAPDIVSRINAKSDANQRWLKTYWSGILPTAILVRLGMHRWAEHAYRRLVKRLQLSA
ncbi:CFI-box-CTERM domain-containing protein [Aliidiomarina shirensis]|nr:CFI-box-CTERM domain-containing protein [Aliidiomarina shirensis]